MEGYYSIRREHTETLLQIPLADLRIYIYLLSRASYKDTPLSPRGTLFDSLDTIAQRTRLGRKQCYNGLGRLVRSQLIAQNGNRNGNTIRLVGYNNHDLVGTETGTRREHEGNTRGTRREPIEEVRREEGKKEISTTYVQNEFERVWARYPKRRGKKAALRHYLASVKSAEDVQAVHVALDAYLAEIKAKGSDLQYVQNGSTWFNDWQSFKDQPKPNLSAPKQTQSPPAIESWRIVPKDEDLVDPSEIHHLITSLRSGNGFKGAS